jgi:hypothetical protein
LTEGPPIVSLQHSSYDDIIAIRIVQPEITMIRIFPTAMTAAYLAFTSLATWLLCETDALSVAAPVFFH